MSATHEEAEDLLQDAFMTAFRKLSTYRGRAKLSTWLYRVCFNSILMSQRRRHSPRATKLFYFDPYQLNLISDLHYSGRDQIFPDWRTWNLVQAELNHLPTILRSAFVLSAFDGLTYAGAARELGVSKSCLRARYHRAKVQLRERLAELR